MKLLSWLQEPQVSVEGDENGEPPLAPLLRNRLEELKATPLKEVMIPRALVTALDADVQLRRVRRLKSAKVSYFPVYKGDLDQILGWVAKPQVVELLNEPNEEINLADHVKPVGDIKETASVADLADVFLQSKSPLVIVKNEAGATVGIVSLADFLEAVFGFELGAGAHTGGGDVTLRSYEI